MPVLYKIPFFCEPLSLFCNIFVVRVRSITQSSAQYTSSTKETRRLICWRFFGTLTLGVQLCRNTLFLVWLRSPDVQQQDLLHVSSVRTCLADKLQVDIWTKAQGCHVVSSTSGDVCDIQVTLSSKCIVKCYQPRLIKTGYFIFIPFIICTSANYNNLRLTRFRSIFFVGLYIDAAALAVMYFES